MRVAGVGVGVDSEGTEGEVKMGGDDDSRDDGLLGKEELDVSSGGTSRKREEVTRSLNRLVMALRGQSKHFYINLQRIFHLLVPVAAFCIECEISVGE